MVTGERPAPQPPGSGEPRQTDRDARYANPSAAGGLRGGRGLNVAVFLPLYRCAREAPAAPQPTEHVFRIPVGTRSVSGRLWRSALPDCGVPVYLVEQADYFERDDPALGCGLYQFMQGGGLRDYPDNCARFVLGGAAVPGPVLAHAVADHPEPGGGGPVPDAEPVRAFGAGAVI